MLYKVHVDLFPKFYHNFKGKEFVEKCSSGSETLLRGAKNYPALSTFIEGFGRSSV